MTTLGMVLAGGAARGAWQSGVLRYIVEEIPKNLGYVPWPAVVSGNSVGALNGVNVAARHGPGVLGLSRVWREMLIEQVYDVRPANLATAIYNSVWASGPFALLDADALRRLVDKHYPHVQLREAIAFGDTRAFIVSATELNTGINTLFLDSHDPAVWLKPLPGTKVRRGHITAEHCLASASLPLLFEPVSVQGRLHVDGMLRQNTPVRPAIQAGCSHILVIGVERAGHHSRTAPAAEVVPTFAFIGGKVLDAALMDPVDRDLRNVERLNELVRWGRRRFGPEFESALEAEMNVREVKVLRINPSEDLSDVARRAYHSGPLNASNAVRALLSLIADPANATESDMLSYLLFDRAYTGAIEALGFEDARRHEEVLVRFMSDATPAPE
ncbi:MAG: patatin-like phospholipase family protein [Myxococcota bacterium]